jgi:signal peptidase I
MVIGRRPKRTLARLGILVVLTLVFLKFFIPIKVSGVSMAPTYLDGRVNLVNKLAYRWQKPKRGDVVAIRLAGERVMLLKRIIALPGERVAIRAGVVEIDGRSLDEPYVKFRKDPRWDRPEKVLQEDEYLVIGDNRSMSDEYHDYGNVYEFQIVGKVLF